MGSKKNALTGWRRQLTRVAVDAWIVKDRAGVDREYVDEISAQSAAREVAPYVPPVFTRRFQSVELFVCDQCGRTHAINDDPDPANTHGADEPEPCDHQASVLDPGPKQPWA